VFWPVPPADGEHVPPAREAGVSELHELPGGHYAADQEEHPDRHWLLRAGLQVPEIAQRFRQAKCGALNAHPDADWPEIQAVQYAPTGDSEECPTERESVLPGIGERRHPKAGSFNAGHCH